MRHLPELSLRRAAQFFLAAFCGVAVTWIPHELRAADAGVPFEGEKTAWHDGFDRYDFVMDNETLAITPMAAAKEEGFGAKPAPQGQSRCVVVVPKTAAAGNPWSWRGCYWDHQPQAEVELLRRGFHIAHIMTPPGKQWDAWYAFLTEKHGLSKKPAFVGMSRGGEYELTWATANPDKVSGIYADNPGVNADTLTKLGELAKRDVPVLCICGSLDPILGDHALVIENIYEQWGGRISMMIKEGFGHHPHSLRDPAPIADFIVQSFGEKSSPAPAFAGGKFTKTAYYSNENSYRDFPKEGTHITCRGPWFTGSFDRYKFSIEGVSGAVTVIAPKSAAPGNPWVYRADFAPRDAAVDLTLLGKGFHIVTGPAPFNADNLSLPDWNTVYKYLTGYGFSPKPVLEGDGGAAGEAYQWAIENPDKTACVYAENPVLHGAMSKKRAFDYLGALAAANVPLLHVCGSLDPGLEDNTRAVEQRYKILGGQMKVIMKDGEGHYPLAPNDPKPVVDFIMQKVVDLPAAAAKREDGKYLTLNYPASTAPGELQVAVTYTLWIPNGAPQLRGIIVHQHGAGTTASIEGGTAVHDLHWQALAKKWDCALFGASYHVLNEKIDLSPDASELWFDPRNGSEKTFLRALAEFAAKSGHPEIEKVPWALWGHSGGGIWSDVMSTLHPERVVAMWLRSGTAAMFRTHPEFPQPTIPEAAYGIPIMTNPGVKEKSDTIPDVKGQEKGPWLGNLATFREYRAKGALIGFAPDPRTGHECGDSRYLAIPFLDACLAMRLPDKGSRDQTLKPVDTSHAWLATVLGGEAQPAAEFKGNRAEAVWLPNEAVAKAWMEYVKTGAVSDSTPPPAPHDVQALMKAGEGTEIVWSAEADFESGIGGFIILRDGQELGKVPEKPVGKFGRPLFQSMTYHDTPSKPLPEMRYLDASAKPGVPHHYTVVSVNSVGLKSEPSAEAAEPAKAPQAEAATKSGAHADYAFDGTMSREVLENYLSRAISFTELLHDDLSQPRNARGEDPKDNLRLILSSGAKFIGRSLMVWGRERNLAAFLETAKPYAAALHQGDPDIILEGAVFEIVTTGVESIAIPEGVFKAFGLPAETRNFRYQDMLYADGKQVGHWGNNGSVPDMSRLETRMWFYFLATSYIDVGIEAFHFGQVGLMDWNDPGHAGWLDMLGRVRAYAHEHARRHFVLCDAHTPTGGYVEDGKLFFDFHAFPLRIAGVADQPYDGVLQIGYADSLFKRSKGGVTPSGWSCEHLPYLVEFDNFGSRNPGSPSKAPFIWGWDEISWFAVLPEAKRNDWLRYAWNWLKENDPIGHLEMPGSRVIRTGKPDGPRWYWANTQSDACPGGFNTEETIREIWGTAKGGAAVTKSAAVLAPIRLEAVPDGIAAPRENLTVKRQP